MKSLFKGLFKGCKKFKGDEAGVSAVEFALILPILLIFYIGTIEVSRGLTASRKVTSIASSVADLISQQKELSDANLDTIFKAAELMIMPGAEAKLKMHVSSYCMNSNNAIVKDWDKSYNSGTTSITAASPEIVALITNDKESLIVADVEYTYDLITPHSLMSWHSDSAKANGPTAFSKSSWPIQDRYFLRPRYRKFVKNTDNPNPKCSQAGGS